MEDKARNRETWRIAEMQVYIDELRAENKSLKSYNASLEDKIDNLKDVNGELCSRFNAATELARGLYADLAAAAPDLARVWERAHPELAGAK